MLVAIALVTLTAFAGGAALALTGHASPVVAAHLPFAIGVVPLILAAITHFVPVLTRSRGAGAAVLALPFVAQAAGGLAVLAMHGTLPRWALHLAASIDLVAALSLAVWVRRRAKDCLGSPHPGWRWYAAALLMLAVALASVLATAAVPAGYVAWRNLHLHLNTLGLVGLAAFGTLPVLLPTALAGPDPQAGVWLQRNLRLVVGGAVAGSLAAALSALTLDVLSALATPLAVVGAALLITAAGILLAQWLRVFGMRRMLADGSAVVLLTAVAGWCLLLLGGLNHGTRLLAGLSGGLAGSLADGRGAIAAYVGSFLFPLVTGALTQLLPVWRHPGPVTPARTRLRTVLGAGGAWRAGLFFAGALALNVGAALPGAACVVLAVGWFVANVLRGLLWTK